ncbi:MAG: UDP-3-O-(3-hydroxymyristoyl)glucosamine N-acyltransferase [Alphaproteobacteria bacterium]|nr:UDP-3-O-(3-hydroxymyristoyl)glucosamine N-acyltransferase [Alphaproteobacteria bacterium]MCB9930098.1 UDP-3-O-(3-hydroxymyristoyl)glucosamine N-acyltransferase [Alphaproteobacteria bacterium]
MPAPYTLAEIAAALDAAVEGDAGLSVQRLMHPLEASRPDDLIFVMAPELAARLGESPVRQAVLAEGLEAPPGSLDAWITVPRPRFALGLLLDLFERRPYSPPGVHPSAVVEAGVELGDGVSIGALAYVGPNARIGAGTAVLPQATVGADARIGADGLIYPGVRIGERVEIGDRVIIHHNASIGSDGFSYVTPQQASFEAAKSSGDRVAEQAQIKGLRRIASIGTVQIGDDVEIGACAAVDRSNIGATVIGRGTKLDNHVQIGHNVRIGEDCLFSGQVGIAGSVRVGNRVVLAGQVGVADHLVIGDDAVVGGGSGLWKNVEPGQVVMGYPAVPKSDALRQQADLARLPRLLRDMATLKRQVAALLQGRAE